MEQPNQIVCGPEDPERRDWLLDAVADAYFIATLESEYEFFGESEELMHPLDDEDYFQASFVKGEAPWQ